jgi:hypothetical protein
VFKDIVLFTVTILAAFCLLKNRPCSCHNNEVVTQRSDAQTGKE